MRALALLAVVAFGGCSLLVGDRPARSYRGVPECDSLVLPVIDTVAATTLVGFAAYAAYDTTKRHDEAKAVGHVVTLGSAVLAVPFIATSIIGYRRLSRCHAELRTLERT